MVRTPLQPGFSYIEWSAVIAGTVIACAITLVLTQFGSSLGFSIDALTADNDNLPEQFFTLGLWILWVQLLSSIAGGYAAGRLRAPWDAAQLHESEIRDGTHGLLTWALSTLLVAVGVALVGLFATIAASHGAPIDTNPDVPEEYARQAGIMTGFALAAASVVSGAAAWWMGTVGGDHRDRAVDASRYIAFGKRH